MPNSPPTSAQPGAAIPDVAKEDVDFLPSASTSATELSTTGQKRGGATFVTTGLKTGLYEPIDTYEGKHRYDPKFDWEPEEERKVVRKVRREFIVL